MTVRPFLHNLSQKVLLANPDGRLEYLNPALLEYRGQGGEHLVELLHEEERGRVWAQWERGIEAGVSFDLDLRLRRGSDGSWEWHRACLTPLLVGGAVQWLGFIYNIQDRYLAEQNERDRLMAELRAERMQLEIIMGQLPVGVAIAEAPSGRIIAVNREMSRMFLDDLRSYEIQTYSSFLTGYHQGGEPYASDEWPLARAIQQGETVIEEAVLLRQRDDSLMHVEISAAPVRNDQGDIVAGVVAVSDVSDRRRAEMELRENEQRLRLALQVARLGMFELDVDAQRVKWDERSQCIFGVPGRSELGVAEAMARLHPEDLAAAHEKLERAVGNMDLPDVDMHYRVVHEDGVIRWVRVVGQAQFGGAPEDRARRVVGLISDITEQVEAERRLQQALAINEHNLAQLNAVLHQMTEGLGLYDRDGRLVMMNRAAMEIYGFDPEDPIHVVERQLNEQHEMHDLEGNLLPQELCPLGLVLKGEKFGSMVAHVRRRDTGRAWIASFGGTRVLDREGRVLAAIVTMRDVTQLIQIDRQLRELNESLEHQVRERTAVAEERAKQLQAMALQLTQAEDQERRRLAKILHDGLQQLLVGAKYSANVISSRAGENPSLRQAADQIHGLLDESIAAARSLSYELSPPMLYEYGLAAGLGWLVRQMREKQGLEVELRVLSEAEKLPENLMVFLYQSVRELLLNTIKHAGTDRALIEIEAKPDEIAVVVSDRGKGFEPAQMQGEGHGGIGLFGIRERLDLLGGRMEIVSAPGQGTRIRLITPIETAAPVESAEPAAVGPGRESIREVKRRQRRRLREGELIRVLLVDDHAVMRSGLASLIEEEPDLEVVSEAGNGLEAIERVRAERPHVVVMDVAMPQMDGIEATRRIVEENPGICVIGLSMYDEGDARGRMLEAGARAYLSKGGPSETLLTAIRSVCTGC